jgi:hypothetical protein
MYNYLDLYIVEMFTSEIAEDEAPLARDGVPRFGSVKFPSIPYLLCSFAARHISVGILQLHRRDYGKWQTVEARSGCIKGSFGQMRARVEGSS